MDSVSVSLWTEGSWVPCQSRARKAAASTTMPLGLQMSNSQGWPLLPLLARLDLTAPTQFAELIPSSPEQTHPFPPGRDRRWKLSLGPLGWHCLPSSLSPFRSQIHPEKSLSISLLSKKNPPSFPWPWGIHRVPLGWPASPCPALTLLLMVLTWPPAEKPWGLEGQPHPQSPTACSLRSS